MGGELMTSVPPSLAETAHEGRTWLLEAAAPLWSTKGRTTSRLFAERINLAGQADSSYYRTFVQARHVFSFVAIGKLGWSGPWQELIEETVRTLLRTARRADGFFVHSLDVEANPLDVRADLYDQAFMLLALGTAGGALGREEWFDEAEALLNRLESEWTHPLGGFREGEIVDPRIRRQNPHMHLLEAFLALHESSGRDRFREAACSIAEAAAARFVDRASGALLEYFTEELEPAPGIEGRVAEPGHCFEWAWLFERLAHTDWCHGAALSDHLTAFARRYGVDAVRNVAINEVLTDGSVKNGSARLWPQTERLKVAIARYRRLGGELEAHETVAAARGLRQYLDLCTPGLWHDKLREDGTWVDELAPGSSLYHISCAYQELAGVGLQIRRRDGMVALQQRG